MAFLNDISLGHYYPGDSFVHRLDPRTKLIAVMFFMSSLLISFEPIILALFVILSIGTVLLSKLPASVVFRNLRPFIWLFGLTVFIHMFWTKGEVIARVPLIQAQITREGLSMGLVYSLRLALLIVFAAILTLSTLPIELTDALERLIKPLKYFKIPTHEIVLMLTLSLRFIPTLMEEANRLKNAQISRGASFEGSLVQRIKNIVPLILPLFISAFRRADELALAMDARCYAGGEGRTSFKKLVFQRKDYSTLLFSILILILSIAV